MTRSITEISKAIAWQLKESIGEDRFDTWFISEDSLQLRDGCLVVTARDELSLSFVRQQFEQVIGESIRAVLGTQADIRFECIAQVKESCVQNTLFSNAQLVEAGLPPAINHPEKNRGTRRSRRQASPDPVSPLSERKNQWRAPDLASFQFGSGNQLLETAIAEVFAEPGKFNPLVVYGPTGCGKTHLLTAIVTRARQTRRYRRCVNISAEQFTSSFIDALQHRRLTDFRSKFRNLDLLAFDDLHFLSGKQATIVEFQNTIEALLRSGKQILVSSDRPVGELRFADDALFNRLSCGLTCPIRYPDKSGRMAILNQLAERQNLLLPKSVLHLIAERISKDVRLLSGAVNRLKAASLVSGEPLNHHFVDQFLADLFHSQSSVVSLSRIEQAVCDVCGVDPAELKGSKRIARISTARMLAMWLSRKYTSAGLAEIGNYYGGRSHSTVVAAQKKINGLLESDATVQLRSRTTSLSQAVGRLKNTLEVA